MFQFMYICCIRIYISLSLSLFLSFYIYIYIWRPIIFEFISVTRNLKSQGHVLWFLTCRLNLSHFWRMKSEVDIRYSRSLEIKQKYLLFEILKTKKFDIRISSCYSLQIEQELTTTKSSFLHFSQYISIIKKFPEHFCRNDISNAFLQWSNFR